MVNCAKSLNNERLNKDKILILQMTDFRIHGHIYTCKYHISIEKVFNKINLFLPKVHKTDVLSWVVLWFVHIHWLQYLLYTITTRRIENITSYLHFCISLPLSSCLSICLSVCLSLTIPSFDGRANIWSTTRCQKWATSGIAWESVTCSSIYAVQI